MHDEAFKDDADKVVEIILAVFRYGKQTSVLQKMSQGKNRATEGSYRVAQCIAKQNHLLTVIISNRFSSVALMCYLMISLIKTLLSLE